MQYCNNSADNKYHKSIQFCLRNNEFVTRLQTNSILSIKSVQRDSYERFIPQNHNNYLPCLLLHPYCHKLYIPILVYTQLCGQLFTGNIIAKTVA